MELKIIDFNQVRLDLDKGVATDFNTNFHTAVEAPDLSIPTNKPYSFDRWLPLILRTRNLPAHVTQVVSLSRAQVRVIVNAAGASIHTRTLNRAYAEDLRDEVHIAFEKLEFPPEGLFMRLGACSPKDGAHTIPGQMALQSVDDIILRLTTSGRASSSFTNMLNSDDQHIEIFFLPFDSKMGAEREYRVFCAPGSLQITAVSQYRWHKPWVFAHQDLGEMEKITRQILKHIEELHAKIIDDLQDVGLDQKDDLFRTQGFTFDVLYDEELEDCVLIELNTFGVRSACGSCLFHWLRDRDLLYGTNSDVVQFRVAM